MPTFVYAVNHRQGMKLDYGFVLRITKLSELADYFLTRKGTEFQIGTSDYLKSKEFAYLCGHGWSGEGHCRTTLGSTIGALCGAESLKDRPGSVIDVICNFASNTMNGMMKCLFKYGAIYIQKRGGYFPHSSDLVLERITETETYDYPGTDREVRLLQWPHGTHWYAKVGDFDVVDEHGNQKWDTRKEAEKQAKIFIKKKDWGK